MNTGVYVAVSGGVVQQRRLDVISNNLANLNGVSFKSNDLIFESYLVEPEKEGSINPATGLEELKKPDYVYVPDELTDFSQGVLLETGREMDVAIDGQGFYMLDTPSGIMYSRNGNFKIGRDGTLQNSQGHRVMGVKNINNEKQYAPIKLIDIKQISAGKTGRTSAKIRSVSIAKDGAISLLGENVSTEEIIKRGSVAVVTFEGNYRLSKVKGGLYRFEGTGRPKINRMAELRQGFVEQSNVNAIKEMTRMISATRSFESYQKVIQSFDEMSRKVNEEVGKIK